MELILGTAEFNPDGYAGKPCPDKKEIIKILNLAWEGGINLLDTAESYNCTELLENFSGGFDWIWKSRTVGDGYYHYKETEEPVDGVELASVYTITQLKGLKHCIVPFNINNTKFLNVTFETPPFIRSVFDRGRLLEEGYTINDCLTFAKRSCAAGAIIGVRSVSELNDILKVW